MTHPTNPQAMAKVRSIREYSGHPELGVNQDRDTWLTPRYILDSLGHFDLDPCAALSNPGWIGARTVYTVHDDGLSKLWLGRVFCNPPFSKTAPWIEKASRSIGITLVPATVESTTWRTIVWEKAAGILLLHGRTRFCNPDGSQTTGRPLRSIALIGWSTEDSKILENCALSGIYLKSWKKR